MEEVWKDINLSSLHDSSAPGTFSNRHRPTSPSSFRSIILQDFLNRPSSATATAASPTPPLPPPATVLTLNSGPDFYFPTQLNNGVAADIDVGGGGGCDLTPFHALASSVLQASFGKQRFPGDAPVERRNKRMIKNRESAARSRARKQAYINELESEVIALQDENDRLREQQQKQGQILEFEPAHQLPKKRHALQRTSTAPF